MNHHFRFALFLALFIAGCIKEISFETPAGDLGAIVLSGDFTNSQSAHHIRLSHPNTYSVSTFDDISGASISLYDSEGNSADYQEQLTPEGIRYVLPAQAMPAVAGRAYHIEILLDGNRFRSEPQVLLPVVPIDSLDVEARTFNRLTTAGVVVQDRLAAIDLTTTLPVGSENVHLRWEANCVYIFQELPLPGPLPPPTKTCYITDEFNNQVVKLQSISNRGGEPVKVYIGARPIDRAFEHAVYFSVVQRRIDAAAYSYFDQLSKLANPSGSVFDPAPGSLQGNIVPYAGGTEKVLGYFEVAAVDTARLVAHNNTLGPGYVKTPYCSAGYSVKDECYNCLILPYSTLQKPHYWQ